MLSQDNKVVTLRSDKAIEEAIANTGKPTMIVAYTTKGCGVSFMENQPGWHHRVPTDEEGARAIEELESRRVG